MLLGIEVKHQKAAVCCHPQGRRFGAADLAAGLQTPVIVIGPEPRNAVEGQFGAQQIESRVMALMFGIAPGFLTLELTADWLERLNNAGA